MGDPNCIQSSIPSLFLIGPHSVDAGHNDKTVCVAGEMLEHRYGLRWVWERNEGAPGFDGLTNSKATDSSMETNGGPNRGGAPYRDRGECAVLHPRCRSTRADC